MSVGTIILIAAAVLIYFGAAERVLDRMYLSDMAAVGIIALIIAGSFFDIGLWTSPNVSINVGGGIIPILLAIYIFSKADTASERWRAVVATLLVGGGIYALNRYLPAEPQNMIVDPLYLYGIAAGLVAYVLGRSRRSAFIAGMMGIIVADIAHLIELNTLGINGTVAIGGAGAFDAVFIAGIVGVLLAELIGETRESLQGGGPLPENDPNR